MGSEGFRTTLTILKCSEGFLKFVQKLLGVYSRFPMDSNEFELILKDSEVRRGTVKYSERFRILVRKLPGC